MSWTYRCLNAGCRTLYNIQTADPKCPKCKSTKARWVPVQVAVRAVSPSADRDVQKLVADFGLGNINSAQRDRAAKQIAPQARQVQHTFGAAGQGWKIPINTDVNGALQPTCAPAGIVAPMTARIDKPAAESRKLALAKHTTIEARHNPNDNSAKRAG